MKNRIILDLCGGTGAWSKPYKDAGYDVRLVTLPDNDIREYRPPDNVHGILAAPPCKEFSLAMNGINRHMTKAPVRNLEKGLEIVTACMRIIEHAAPIWWSLENPCGLLSRYLGKPKYIFQPWEFGDPWTKRTGLWGKFVNPTPIYKTQQECIDAFGEPIADYFKREKISANPRPGKILPSKADMDRTHFKFVGMREERSAFRAITPAGFAKAFYEANP